MDLGFLTGAMIPAIVGVCLCVGYIVKSWEKMPNKYIPTILAVIGLLMALIMNKWDFSPNIILSGLVSGLASCGLYDTFKHFVEGTNDNSDDEDEGVE